MRTFYWIRWHVCCWGALNLSIALQSLHAQTALDSVRRWTLHTLNTGDTALFQEKLAWANAIVAASSLEERTESLGDWHYLFDVSLLSEKESMVPRSEPAIAAKQRALWDFALFYYRRNPSEAVAPPQTANLPALPQPETNAIVRVLQNPIVFAIAGSLFLWFLLSAYRKRPRVETPGEILLDEPFAGLFERLVKRAEEQGTDEERAWITMFAWEAEQHPLQTSNEHAQLLDNLTETEQMLAAYLHDDIPMDQIAASLKKSTGTLYNLRSTIRKKLGIAEDIDLQKGLRELTE